MCCTKLSSQRKLRGLNFKQERLTKGLLRFVKTEYKEKLLRYTLYPLIKITSKERKFIATRKNSN